MHRHLGRALQDLPHKALADRALHRTALPTGRSRCPQAPVMPLLGAAASAGLSCLTARCLRPQQAPPSSSSSSSVARCCQPCRTAASCCLALCPGRRGRAAQKAGPRRQPRWRLSRRYVRAVTALQRKQQPLRPLSPLSLRPSVRRRAWGPALARAAASARAPGRLGEHPRLRRHGQQSAQQAALRHPDRRPLSQPRRGPRPPTQAGKPAT